MDLDELRDLTPARALRRRFELEERLQGKSPTGGQLERAKAGLGDYGHNGSNSDAIEQLRLRYADYVLVTQALSKEEIDLSRLRYVTLSTPESYETNRRMEDMREGDGEELISPKAYDADGVLLEGFVRVRGIKRKVASDDAVAEHLRRDGKLDSDGQPIRRGAIKRRREEAHAKVSETLRWRLIMALQEDAAV